MSGGALISGAIVGTGFGLFVILYLPKLLS